MTLRPSTPSSSSTRCSAISHHQPRVTHNALEIRRRWRNSTHRGVTRALRRNSAISHHQPRVTHNALEIRRRWRNSTYRGVTGVPRRNSAISHHQPRVTHNALGIRRRWRNSTYRGVTRALRRNSAKAAAETLVRQGCACLAWNALRYALRHWCARAAPDWPGTPSLRSGRQAHVLVDA
jgi:uncharacterized protein with gpF-like domain